MSDDEPLVPEGRAAEHLAEIAEDMISDPETRGFTMGGVGPELGAVAQTVSDGEYDTHVALCAVMLKEHVEGLEAEPTEFIKDVVNEFNERTVSHEYKETN